jgi:hypothetical protein
MAAQAVGVPAWAGGNAFPHKGTATHRRFRSRRKRGGCDTHNRQNRPQLAPARIQNDSGHGEAAVSPAIGAPLLVTSSTAKRSVTRSNTVWTGPR